VNIWGGPFAARKRRSPVGVANEFFRGNKTSKTAGKRIYRGISKKKIGLFHAPVWRACEGGKGAATRERGVGGETPNCQDLELGKKRGGREDSSKKLTKLGEEPTAEGEL